MEEILHHLWSLNYCNSEYFTDLHQQYVKTFLKETKTQTSRSEFRVLQHKRSKNLFQRKLGKLVRVHCEQLIAKGRQSEGFRPRYTYINCCKNQAV